MSGKERGVSRKRRGVTHRSLEGRRMVPEGAYESALLILKRAFLEETSGVGDSDFWQPIEEKATMTPKRACFQYYMINMSHTELAKLCLDHFLTLRMGIQMGEIDKEQQHNLLTKASYFYLREYPPAYKDKIRHETS